MPRFFAARSTALVLSLVVVAGPPAQDSKQPMTIVDLIDLPGLGEPRLSPDGSALLYIRSDADWKQNKTISHIWRVRAGCRPCGHGARERQPAGRSLIPSS